MAGNGNGKLCPLNLENVNFEKKLEIIEKSNFNCNSIVNETPSLSTPEMCIMEDGDISKETRIQENESQFYQNGLSSILLSQKYIPKDFCCKEYLNQHVSLVLKKIRIENISKVIISHLNVKFFAPKLDSIRTIFSGNVDIMVFTETKIDVSYPTSQLKINGFKKPYRLDRDAFGGRILIYEAGYP